MTHQLQQSIKLLQLSAQERSEYIDQEIEKNPLLAREDAPGEGDTAPGDEGREEAEVSERESERAEEREADPNDVAYEEEGFATPAISAGGHEGGGYGGDGEFNAYDQLTEAPSLREHLLEQL